MYLLGWIAYSGRRYATWYGLMPVSTTAMTTCDLERSRFVHVFTRSPSKPNPGRIPGDAGSAGGASPFVLSGESTGSQARKVKAEFAPLNSVTTAKREPSGMVPASPPAARVM
jgi:hypothetical protein